MSDDEKNAALGPNSVPVLPRGVRLKVDNVRGKTVLLGPERTIDLDPVAAAIAGAIDGERNLSQILDHLCTIYNARRGEIEADVVAFLTELVDRRLLEMRS